MLADDPRFERIDAMSGTEFELALVELLQLLGYEDVRRIGGFDKGADIICVRDGALTAVQAKRKSTAVGIDAVRQLVDGRKRYDCAQGLVVTNSFFTDQASECAEEWDIELWDRRVLAEWLEGDAPVVDHTVCAECGTSVTRGIQNWCLSNPHRCGGNVYCRAHQSRRSRS